MDDKIIVALYHERNEQALSETRKKYHSFLLGIAHRILYDHEDGEECVNDTYFDAWNAMPPHRPDFLSAFLAKITRRISIDRLRRNTAAKRGGAEYDLSLEELGEIVSGKETPEDAVEFLRLRECIETFIKQQKPAEGYIFICRYFFFYPLKDIAESCATSESNIKNILYRQRLRLKTYLEKEGFEL